MLQGISGIDISHPRTSTVGNVQDYNALSFARFQCVSNRALVNALIMSWTMLPTHCPHCIASSHCESTVLCTAQAASSVVMKELV